MQVVFKNGIHLPGPRLWLDPHQAQPVAVVSHAHADHICRHEHVLTSAPTAAMMRLRGVYSCRFETLTFGEPLDLDGALVTLYPAGHVLGSAQVLVEWEGTRLLYSGDFKLRAGRSAEVAEVPRADMVIMETTFGQPRYRFPDTDTVVEDMTRFCATALDEGYAPVLFCYSLGKGQEVLACLEDAGFPIYLHETHWQMSSLYREYGVKLPFFRKFQPGRKLDGVLLCASGCRRSSWYENMSRLNRVRTAYISGWALDAGARRRFRTDAAFPLSDHADYDDLLEYVRLTGAHTIYTVHGFADDFAADLRRRGYQAQPLRDGPGGLPLPTRRGAKQAPSAGQLCLF